MRESDVGDCSSAGILLGSPGNDDLVLSDLRCVIQLYTLSQMARGPGFALVSQRQQHLILVPHVHGSTLSRLKCSGMLREK